MASPARPSRLEPPVAAQPIEPFVRATRLEGTWLYWLSVAAWPPSFRDRLWIVAFFDKLISFAEAEWKVAPQQFLTMNIAGGDLRSTFLRNAREVLPVMGAMARPGRVPVALPSTEEIDQATKKKATLSPGKYSEDYAYWFVRGKHEQQRRLFQGYGGMTIVLAEPDETSKVALPNLPAYMMDHPSMAKFKSMDLKSEVRVAETMGSNFGSRSKELFGEPLKDLAIFASLPFVLPQWASSTFFNAKPEQIEALFSLCKLYIHESIEDKGIVLACAEDLNDIIASIVQRMKTEDQMEYKP